MIVITDGKLWKYIYDLNTRDQGFEERSAYTDGADTYTYADMFKEWHRYAAVFTALHMTGEDNARVGIDGSGSAACLFSIYGLNMTGAEVSVFSPFRVGLAANIIQIVKEEHLTDLILTDHFITPEVFRELLACRKRLGLRNVILLSSPTGGAGVPESMRALQKRKDFLLKRLFAKNHMDTLMEAYKDTPISCGPDESGDTAFILHTSGTTGGRGKPIVLSDGAIIESIESIRSLKEYDFLKEDLISALAIDVSAAYGFVDQVNLVFANHGLLAAVPGVCLNPEFYKVIDRYEVNLLFCAGTLIELWMKAPQMVRYDFSHIRGLVLGGSIVTAKDKKRYKAFFEKHGGSEVPIIVGYGLSEVGGVCTLSPDDPDDESIGYLLPHMEGRLYDESSKEYRRIGDGPADGLLYLHSSSMAGKTLDGHIILKTDEIDGKEFFCTYDRMHADADGKLTYMGRANRYFLNDEGIKYQAGLVETLFSRQKGIERCGIVPVYIKQIHDNVPMLCVKTIEEDGALATVRQAIKKMFLTDQILELTQLPYRVLVARELPINKNGKLDLYRISRGDVEGTAYEVDTHRDGDKVSDIRLQPVEQDADNVFAVVQKELLKDRQEDVTGQGTIGQTPDEAEYKTTGQGKGVAAMDYSDSNLRKKLKKEIVRMMIEQTQNMDFQQGAFGAQEDNAFDDVEEIFNIAYINREEVPLAMDIFKPRVPEGTELPVVVAIHGGGLTQGERKTSRPFGRFMAHRGYLVFSLEYRLAPRADVCQQLDDVCAGLDEVGRRLVDYDVDFTRIFMAGESAGAYLATYVAAMKSSQKLRDAIGREPSKLTFKAIGLISGMFYTNRKDPYGGLLAEQIYGSKIDDENFLQYMDPENPEIINNLPPSILITGRGDFLNNYTLMMYDVLKKAGRPCKLIYSGDPEIEHAFNVLQANHPTTIKLMDRMLGWFEEQADLKRSEKERTAELAKVRRRVSRRLNSGAINNQRIWQYIRERAETDPDRMYAPALMDGTTIYTYRTMFEQWDSYARVFSALHMTGADGSRVAIAGAISAEPLFAFYGLNMTGAAVSMFSYPDFLPGGRWKQMVEKEKITDLIITDIMVTPQMWYKIRREKEKLGLRNIIFIHSPLGGPCTGPAELAFNEFNYHALKRLEDTVFMDDLIPKYAGTEITYGEKGGDHLALITHTSGTTKGTRKPLPYTDRAVNSVATNLPGGTKDMIGMPKEDRIKVAPSFDFSSFLNMAGLTNINLAAGGTIVLTFFGFMHPKFIRAVDYYKLDVVFAGSFMMDRWIEREDIDKVDFSSVKMVSCGGAYVPPDKLREYQAYLERHGYKGGILRGYAMSETGGAELTVPVGCMDDILGYPNPKEGFRILDENDEQFYTVDDGVRTGIMYIASDSKCSNELDGEPLFDYTVIDGENFICSNDKVRVNEDGSISYVGRADRYFVNNEGVRFDAGIVDVKLLAHPLIDKCAVVPIFDKRIHDSVPIIYVVPSKQAGNPVEGVRKALVDVFVKDEELQGNFIPTQFVITDAIPYNASGKIDTYRITRERLKGVVYNISPIVEDGKPVDIKVIRSDTPSSMLGGDLPGNMGKDSAFNLFDLFNTPVRTNSMRWPVMPKMKQTGQDTVLKSGIEAIKKKAADPENVKKMKTASLKLQNSMFNHVDIKHDYEE